MWWVKPVVSNFLPTPFAFRHGNWPHFREILRSGGALGLDRPSAGEARSGWRLTYLLHQTEHWHLYFSGWDPVFISKHPATRGLSSELSFLAWGRQKSIPFGGVSEEVAADLGSVRDDRGVVEKRFVPDLHLEELLIPGGQLLGPGAERQQQQQERQRAAQQ